MNLHVLLALAGYYLFSSAAGAMPLPLPAQQRGWYGFCFRWAQNLAANGHRLAEAKLPGLIADIAAAELLLAATAHVTQPRTPGEIPDVPVF